MKFLKILLTLAILCFCAFMTFVAYLGGFSKVTIEQKNFPATEIMFTTHKGPYESIKDSWVQFEEDFRSLGLEDCDGYGVYLDPPSTPPEELRSIIACSTANISPELKEKLKTKFSLFTLPQADTFSSSFPYKNELSFFIGSYRVYPEFQNLIASNTIQPSVAIEGYGLQENRTKILFYMPKDKLTTDYQGLIDAFKN